MDDNEIRLRLVEGLISVAPRAEIQDPELLVKKASVLEKYVNDHVVPRAKRIKKTV